MRQGNGNTRDRRRLVTADPERLSRDELIDLVRGLQSALSGSTPGEAPESPSSRPRRAEEPRRTANRAAKTAADYTLVFDGGSLGNPGLGYGSYEISGPAGTTAARKLEFGKNMTNNQAEFHALLAGLERLLELAGQEVSSTSIAIRGDSQLVIRGLTGEWRVRHPGLQPLHRQALDLLQRFGSADIAWHPRRESVRAFGH
ncbi:MAG: ribonuclease HI family protein [Thermomicrobiales bacterium]|nr:ribonuclease HI family protein [Thermomicrobiales bacterium]